MVVLNQCVINLIAAPAAITVLEEVQYYSISVIAQLLLVKKKGVGPVGSPEVGTGRLALGLGTAGEHHVLDIHGIPASSNEVIDLVHTVGIFPLYWRGCPSLAMLSTGAT